MVSYSSSSPQIYKLLPVVILKNLPISSDFVSFQNLTRGLLLTNFSTVFNCSASVGLISQASQVPIYFTSLHFLKAKFNKVNSIR